MISKTLYSKSIKSIFNKHKGNAVKTTLYSYFFILCTFITLRPVQVSMQPIEKNSMQQELTLAFDLQPNENIIKQTLKISLDSPAATLSQPVYSAPAHKQYLNDFKDSKEVFNRNFTATVTAQKQSNDFNFGNIHISFLATPTNKFEEKIFPLDWQNHSLAATQYQATTTHSQDRTTYSIEDGKSTLSWTESFQNIVNTTDSLWIRLFFAFLLGLLLSLTPCIYPMIPITIGILHRHGKKSLIHNFLGSLCYAVGLSTTFAVFGLLAAFAGASFGGLLSQPIFVIILTFFIGFMSLSMIGVYDMPVPSFMKGNADVGSSTFGPFVSAFIFGILSGTIASPCVSPGLALLLTIVATMGHVLSGFFLLFAFGIGMSVPLMIIGTFSTSLQMLPQAGQWMVEIKKFLGFVMLATCFYYLSNILPMHIVMWLFVMYLIFAALFYIIDAQKSFDDTTKTIKSLIGIVLLGFSIYTGFKAYDSRKPQRASQSNEIGVSWAKDYASALAQAKEQNKLLLLDFWANHCTICKAIDKKLFKKDLVAQQLNSHVIFYKVDCTSSSNEEATKLKKQYSVFAQPAILVIDPNKEVVLKKWSSEPYNMSPQEFVHALKSI